MGMPFLELLNISKSFGTIKALSKVSIKLDHGEVLAIVGDNAAGKSTLLKIIAGVYFPDEGEIIIDGVKTRFKKPLDARKIGIETIYQDFMLAPNLDITKNIFLGHERTRRFGLLDKKSMDIRTREGLSDLIKDLKSLNLRTLVNTLSGGQQQMVAIGRALLFNPKLVLMDEPTASLSMVAIKKTIELVFKLKKSGVSIIYISHRLTDVLSLADRILVLKTGQLVAEVKPENTSIDELVRVMVGMKEKE